MLTKIGRFTILHEIFKRWLEQRHGKTFEEIRKEIGDEFEALRFSLFSSDLYSVLFKDIPMAEGSLATLDTLMQHAIAGTERMILNQMTTVAEHYQKAITSVIGYIKKYDTANACKTQLLALKQDDPAVAYLLEQLS